MNINKKINEKINGIINVQLMFKTKREARLNLNVNYLCYALRALF